MKILGFIKRELPYFIIMAFGLGLLKGHFAPMEFSKVICVSALLVMIYPIMINLRIENGFNLSGAGKPLIVSLIINFIISPILAIIISKLFFAENPYIAIGFYLIGLIPTSGMTINWIHNLKANMHTGIVLVTFNVLTAVLIVPFALPFLIKFVLHLNSFEINPMLILEKLGFVIIFPMFLGWLTRFIAKLIKKDQDLIKAKALLGGISNIGLLIVLFLVMSLESSQVVVNNFRDMLDVFIPVILYYIAMLAITIFIIQKMFVKKQGLAVLFSTFLRYHVISLGIVLAAFGDTADGTWVLLPIIIALLIQPLVTAILAKNFLVRLHFKI